MSRLSILCMLFLGSIARVHSSDCESPSPCGAIALASCG